MPRGSSASCASRPTPSEVAWRTGHPALHLLVTASVSVVESLGVIRLGVGLG